MNLIYETIKQYVLTKYKSLNSKFFIVNEGYDDSFFYVSVGRESEQIIPEYDYYYIIRAHFGRNFCINPACSYEWSKSNIDVHTSDPKIFEKLDNCIFDVCFKYSKFIQVYNRLKLDDNVIVNNNPLYIRYKGDLIYFIDTKTYYKNKNRIYISYNEPNPVKICEEFINRKK